MLRLVTILAVLIALGVTTPGCQDEGESQAEEMGFKTGQRPPKSEKRPPPGPGQEQGGFQMSEDPPDEPDEPDDPD